MRGREEKVDVLGWTKSITVPWVGSAAGVNGPVLFLAKGTKVNPRIRGTNLVTKYGFPE